MTSKKDIIIMSQKELKRLHIIKKVIDKRIKQTEASEILNLSTRQIRRITRRIAKEGDKGIIHKSRGKSSERKLPDRLKKKAISLYRNKYQGFGPTLFSEKLFEIDKIKISDETLRRWLMEAGYWQKRRKKKKHRRWRKRKEYLGQMIQIDGSHHRWFENRGPECVFMGYIDDATNKVFGRFYKYEGSLPAMDSFKRYIRKYGLPQSIYLDKHTTYKSPAKPSIEDQLNDIEPLSQFERALNELSVEVIHANSPQAKGRIERLFKTFQDRLIKEMRLKRIKNIDGANEFLKIYLPKHNRAFSVKPAQKENMHRTLPPYFDIDSILCIKTEHPLRGDFTIVHNKKLYQILDKTPAKKVTVQERVDGSMHIIHNQNRLKYKEITRRPQKEDKPDKLRIKKICTPPMDHPWKKPMYERRLRCLRSRNKAEKEQTLAVATT